MKNGLLSSPAHARWLASKLMLCGSRTSQVGWLRADRLGERAFRTVNGKYLIYFAGYKKHVGVYPDPIENPEFKV